MVLTIIGTGRVGTNLHAAFTHAGHKVKWLRGRDFHSSDVEGEVIIISVLDDVVNKVASSLQGCDALIVHTAGSLPMDILPQSRRGVLYPMQTFDRELPANFKEISIFLETSNKPDMNLLQSLASSISPKVYTLSSEERQYLHLAAVFACNFVNHCYSLSADILKEHDLPFDVMLPLIDQTAKKVHTIPPAKAQTGPAIRQDQSVIAKQSNLLNHTPKEIYQLMTQSIQEYDKL